MSIESILEHEAWSAIPPTSGTISTTNGTPNIVGVGTAFLTDLVTGDLILWTDSSGNPRATQVKTVTDDLNVIAGANIGDTVAGASFFIIKQSAITCPYFQVDNTRLKSFIVSGQSSYLQVNGGKSQISANEGLNLKSVYFRLPYQFTMADGMVEIGFRYLDAAGVSLGSVQTIGENGFIQIPVENIETPFDVYIPPPSGLATTDTWQLAASFSYAAIDLETAEGIGIDEYVTPSVSQIDSPDALNGALLPIYIGARVIHAAQALT